MTTIFAQLFYVQNNLYKFLLQYKN